MRALKYSSVLYLHWFSSTSLPFIIVMSHWKLSGQESCTAKAHMGSLVLQNNTQRVSQATVFEH